MTNHVLAALGGLLFFCGPFAPDLSADSTVEEKVTVIRTRYDEIERDLSRCKQVKRDLPRESTDGGELTAYFLGQSIGCFSFCESIRITTNRFPEK